jgi:hypothetical protein
MLAKQVNRILRSSRSKNKGRFVKLAEPISVPWTYILLNELCEPKPIVGVLAHPAIISKGVK